MVTKEQFISGVIKYIDSEVIPNMSQVGKWIVGTMVVLASNKIKEIVDTFTDNELIKALNVVNDQGMIDSSSLISALHTAASKYGKLSLTIPYTGTLTFCASDIDRLSTYIGG